MSEKLKAPVRRAVSRFWRPFRRDLEDPNRSLSFDFERDSTTLLIAFGGMQGLLGIPPFEFFKATGEIPVKRLFVRDLHQAWYHRGIPEYGDDIDQVADALRSLLEPHGVQRLVVAGNSAGGYAALLFGSLLEASTALCFAPQTVIDPEILENMRDDRWKQQLTALIDAGALQRRWADLGSALPAVHNGRTRYEVFFDAGYELDRLHAERVSDVPGLTIHAREGGKHSIAQTMRASGELRAVLREALAP